MPERLAIAIFILKIFQMLAALSILVLAAVSPRYIWISVSLFGVTAATIAAAVIVEGGKGDWFLDRAQSVGQSSHTSFGH